MNKLAFCVRVLKQKTQTYMLCQEGGLNTRPPECIKRSIYLLQSVALPAELSRRCNECASIPCLSTQLSFTPSRESSILTHTGDTQTKSMPPPMAIYIYKTEPCTRSSHLPSTHHKTTTTAAIKTSTMYVKHNQNNRKITSQQESHRANAQRYPNLHSPHTHASRREVERPRATRVRQSMPDVRERLSRERVNPRRRRRIRRMRVVRRRLGRRRRYLPVRRRLRLRRPARVPVPACAAARTIVHERERLRSLLHRRGRVVTV